MNTSQLTFTRFIAAVSIVIFHFGKGVFPFNHGLLAMLFNNSNVAVSYFFNLSGFVMIIAYGAGGKNVNARKYYINRFAKIYPVYALAFIAMLLFAGTFALSKLLGEVFLIQSAVPQFLPPYNLPDWSLSVEVFFYLLFPLVFNKFYKKNSLKTCAAWIIGFWVLSQIICYWLSTRLGSFSSQNVIYVYYNPFLHLNEFFTGNLIGMMYLEMRNAGRFKKDQSLIVLLLLLTLVALLLPALRKFDLRLPVNFHNGLLLVIFSPFILLLALNRGYINRVFSMPFLIYLGEISYCIYILQFPVYQAWWRLVGNTSSALKSFYAPLLLLIIVSALAYQFVEGPCKNLIRAKLAGRV